MAQQLYNWSQELRRLRFGWLLLMTIIGEPSLPVLLIHSPLTLIFLIHSGHVLPPAHRLEHEHLRVRIRVWLAGLVPRRRWSAPRGCHVVCGVEDSFQAEDSFVVAEESQMGCFGECHRE